METKKTSLENEFNDKITLDSLYVHKANSKIDYLNGKQLSFKDTLNPKKKIVKVKCHLVIESNVTKNKLYFCRFSKEGETKIFESKRFEVVA